MAMTDEQRRWF
jgi:hypothetical protein